MRFTKMNGAGNDFVVLDAVQEPLAVEPDDISGLVYRLCSRHFGVGADGVMILRKPKGRADIAMQFYNADGSMGEMCGNGARCVCRYAYEHGYAGDTVLVETTAGLVTGWRQKDNWFRIRLNTPSVLETEKTLRVDGREIHCGYVELGDPGIPHLTVQIEQMPWDGGAEQDALRELGRKLRNHPVLKKGANVNFYQITGPQDVYEMTYERGVEDFTMACGTGTGSVAAVLTASGRMDGRNISFAMAGGSLFAEVQKKDGRVSELFLTGSALNVFTGELAEDFLHPVVIEDLEEKKEEL